MRADILGKKSYAAFKKGLSGSGCAKCALSTSRTNIVVDRGNPEAKVLFIGEAPGENEDRLALAFVGRSGRLLDQMMSVIGFDTERDGLIVNVVKCRPPKNRKPSSREAAACSPFLKKQIELVGPRHIILLGATALKYVLPKKKIASMKTEVGKFFEDPAYPGARLIIFYHPAFILRDPRKKPLMESHIRRFGESWNR